MLKTIWNNINAGANKISPLINRFSIPIIIIIASIARIWMYGDPNLSIAGNDTPSYVESSQVPLFSKEIMMGRRMLTTNLLYKLFEPEDGYKILVNGSIETTRRLVQPAFNNIVFFQLLMSLAGWGSLAYMMAKYIKNPIMKILAAFIVTVFGYTPQIADWDSILMSESLTYSLFALQLTFFIYFVFSIYDNPEFNSFFPFILWAIVYFFWTFARDSSLYVSLITIGLTGVLFFSTKYRKNKLIRKILILLSAIFILGFYTSSNSSRSLLTFINIYNDDLLPSPARVETLMEFGMPEPYTEAYNEWFEDNSVTTLIKYMIIHPGYPTTKLIRDFPQAFTEIKQTYFNVPRNDPTRTVLMSLGDLFHPEHASVFVLCSILLIGLMITAQKDTRGTSRPWAWLGSWLYLAAGSSIVLVILGDTWGLNRHALLSTMIFRLFMWIFTLIIIDIAIERNVQDGAQINQALGTGS